MAYKWKPSASQRRAFAERMKDPAEQAAYETCREKTGKRIARLRVEMGISQMKLAELSGVGYSHIARIELGRYSVGIDTLSKIASALDCSIDFVKNEKQSIP